MKRYEAQSDTAQDLREYVGEPGESSGWTTTKIAAKVLGVSRRTVQGYVHRGELEARQEGEGVNKTFYISIDSLNALHERRKRKASSTANFSEGLSEASLAANVGESISEALRLAIKQLEARTAEAADLRVRLELTARTEQSLLEDLERERQERREAQKEARRLREELVAEQSKGFFRRLFGR